MADRESMQTTASPASILDSLADEIAARIAELEAKVAPTVAEINRLREAHASLTGGNDLKPQERRQASKSQQRRKGDAPARVLWVLQRSGSPMTGAEIGREIGNKTPHSLLAWMVASGQLVKHVETKTYTVAERYRTAGQDGDDRDDDAESPDRFADTPVAAARVRRRDPDEAGDDRRASIVGRRS